MHNPRYKNGFNLTVHEDLVQTPLEWKKPKKIFVNSMSDIFHEDLSDDIILKIFDTMNRSSWHIFQVLTKRSDRLCNLSNKINWTQNIWMGVTIESNVYTYRAEHLKKTKAKIKFISAEPLLTGLKSLNLKDIDWLIVGGESGHKARPIENEWVLELRDMAKEEHVPFFFKQWGGKNKKKNGRLLDGEIFDEYPNID